LNPRGGAVGTYTENKMSQKQTLFQMVGFLHTRCHLELTTSQHLLLWIP